MNKIAVRFGTFGGFIAGVFPTFFLGDLLKTMLLAAVGACVSFFVSLVLGTLFKRKK